MVEVVNVVGSGLLNKEFDLSAVADELGTIADFDPGKYPGMYIRFTDEAPLITMYRTGKFIITGAESINELNLIKDEFTDLLESRSIIGEDDLNWFDVQNLVCTTVLSGDVNLNALAVELGFEHTEFEPEQFPGLIYRSPDFDCVVLIFSTGKAVITGSSDLDRVEAVEDYLIEELPKLHLN